MKKLPVSVCLISGAEAHRIGRALASVADWAAEIIVVLNEEVADGTDEIARQHGAKVHREPWKGHIAQKNSAAGKATQDWILGLDADEAVSPELRAELEALFADPTRLGQMTAYDFPRMTRFAGKWIRHGDWYPDRQTRLWRRGKAQWGGVDPHDHLEVQGAVGRLRSNLFHFTAENIDRQIAKITPFSADFARHLRASGRNVTWLDLAVRPFWKFFRGYILRLGFLDGWQGYYIAWLNAFSVVTKYARLLEPEPDRKPGP